MSAVGHILAIAATLCGIVLLYWQRKRRFDRTNAYGVQRFSSYFGKLRAMAWDGFLWLAGAILLPVYAYLLFMLFGT